MATDETTSAKVQTAQDRPQTAAEQRAASHDGTTDTDQLVSDIEKTRGELAETLDAIVDKVDPKNVADRAKAQARESAMEVKAQARESAKEGVQDAKAAAATAAAAVKEKASTATEAVKEKAAEVKEKVSGSSDSEPVRSPLAPATSVSVDAATPVTGAATTGAAATGTAATAGASPLPGNAQSVDAGGLPPAEPADTPGSLADRADTTAPTVEPAGADLPASSPARPAAYEPSQVPAMVGAGAAAAAAVGAALVLLVLRRRRH